MTRILMDDIGLLESIRELGIEITQEKINSVLEQGFTTEKDKLDKMHPLTRTFLRLSFMKEHPHKIEVKI